MSRHEAGLVAASTAAEPLIDIAYFNTLFSTPAPSSGQRASRFACDEVKLVYAGEGTPWIRTCGSPALVPWTRPHTFASDWHPASVLPPLGVRRVRRANRGWDWLPVAQAKKRFAELNGGNPWEPWEPQLTKLTWPKVKSIDVDRLQMKKLRDDALRRGYDALWTRKPTWLMKPLRRSYCGAVGVRLFKAVTVKCVEVLRPAGTLDPEARWLRSWLSRRPRCYAAAARTPEIEPEIRTDLQDEILKLHARGGSLGVIREASQARGLQIDDDGVQAVLGPAGHMFGEGDPSADALMDDEVEAFNAGPGHSPEKIRPRGRRQSYPRYNQRITYEKPRYFFWVLEAYLVMARWSSPAHDSRYHAGVWHETPNVPLDAFTQRQNTITLPTHYSALPYNAEFSHTGRSPWSHKVGLIETDASWPSERWPRIPHPWFRISHIDTPYVAFGAIVSFSEVASLWNERPKATTSVDAINGYSEDADWQAQYLRQKAMSAADYDAVAGVGRSVRTGPEPRQFPRKNAKQADLTRRATELIELNPAQSDIPEQQTQCEDWWAAAIRNYAYGRDRVYVDDVGRHVAKKFEHGKFGKKEQLRIGKIFVAMGWEPWRAKNGRGFVNRDRHHFSQ